MSAESQPIKNDHGRNVFWRTLLTIVVGFSLPIAACYGGIVTAAVALNVMATGSGGGSAGFTSLTSGSGPAVALIRIEGAIVSGRGSPFDSTPVAASGAIISKIEKAKNDPDVKAIVLLVDSPGGGVVASDEIYHALKNVNKPIVVSISDIGASGAYYISMASSWVVANPNSLVGSVGVISQFPHAEGLAEKVGVDFVVITSGPRKDFGSPWREMTKDEREYWQKIVDETYESFVKIVADGRKLPVDDVKKFADGRVYTGRQALALKMIDQLGYQDEAIAKAAELGGIKGKPRTIEYKPTSNFIELLSQSANRSTLPTIAEIMNLIGAPKLEARWVGP